MLHQRMAEPKAKKMTAMIQRKPLVAKAERQHSNLRNGTSLGRLSFSISRTTYVYKRAKELHSKADQLWEASFRNVHPAILHT